MVRALLALVLAAASAPAAAQLQPDTTPMIIGDVTVVGSARPMILTSLKHPSCHPRESVAQYPVPGTSNYILGCWHGYGEHAYIRWFDGGNSVIPETYINRRVRL